MERRETSAVAAHLAEEFGGLGSGVVQGVTADRGAVGRTQVAEEAFARPARFHYVENSEAYRSRSGSFRIPTDDERDEQDRAG